MSLIFINYRRDDTQAATGRLANDVRRVLKGEHFVFYDHVDVPSGARFGELIRSKAGSCDVLLAVIGNNWLTNESGQRRLDDPTDWVRVEIESAIAQGAFVLPVLVDGAIMPSGKTLPPSLVKLAEIDAFTLSHERWDRDLEDLVRLLKGWLESFRLRPYTFSNEKDIIREYTKPDGPDEVYRADCPRWWPEVLLREGIDPFERPNPIKEDEIGKFRPEGARIRVNVSEEADGPAQEVAADRRILTFREAGPRARIVFPSAPVFNVGIIVSGGIAPGINAVIHGIVSRHDLYHQRSKGLGLQRLPRNIDNDEETHGSLDVRTFADQQPPHIYGYDEGFKALLRGGPTRRLLTVSETRDAVNWGGSILKTARVQELLDPDAECRRSLMKEIVRQIVRHKLRILYIIGGDGSMRAAFELGKMAEKMRDETPRDVPWVPSIVGIPKTMDNDILWVWQSFGFLSAVDKATEAIVNLHTEVTSNPRLGVVQLFGSDSGFVVSHAVLASGVCDLALIPEVPFTMDCVCKYLLDNRLYRRRYGEDANRLYRRRYGEDTEYSSPWGMVVMAETAIPQDAQEYYKDKDVDLTTKEINEIEAFIQGQRRVRGQTPDDLRSGGLKIVSRVLQRELKNCVKRWGDTDLYWDQFRVVTNEPRHLIRSTPPSVSDVIFGQRLGTLAVDNAMAGFTQFMVSQWLTEYVLVPLDLVTVGRKRVPQDGIFWKSVLASTGQPTSLTSCTTR